MAVCLHCSTPGCWNDSVGVDCLSYPRRIRCGWFNNTLSSYIVKIYAGHATSADASVGLLRAILSGVFPLVGRQMFRNLGSNNAVLILASIAMAFYSVAALFGVYGKRIRKRGALAENTWLALQDDSERSLSCTDDRV